MLGATSVQEDAVEVLLEGGAGIEQADEEGCRPLHHAAREGLLPMVRLLLARGAAVDAGDGGLWTPLLWAAYTGGHLSLLLLLLHSLHHPHLPQVTWVWRRCWWRRVRR